jgi:hypothetical protein
MPKHLLTGYQDTLNNKLIGFLVVFNPVNPVILSKFLRAPLVMPSSLFLNLARRRGIPVRQSIGVMIYPILGRKIPRFGHFRIALGTPDPHISYSI